MSFFEHESNAIIAPHKKSIAKRLAEEFLANSVVKVFIGAKKGCIKTIDIYNGSGTAGVAQTEADKLEEKNFTIGKISNAPQGDYARYTIYQIGKGNSGTAAKLKEIYGVTPLTTAPPVAAGANTKFIVIVGPAPASTSTTN